MRRTLKQIVAEYGVVAACIYLTLFFAVLVGSWFGIQRGVDLAAVAARVGLNPNGFAADLGAWTAAYIFTKVLQPLRIAATVVLTPFVARIYEHVVARRVSRKQ